MEVDRLVDGRPVQLSLLRSGMGRRVLLLHGFASDAHDDWVATGWFDALALAGYEVVAPDLRGHGLSTKSRNPSDYQLGAFATDILAASEACWGEASFDVIGYSMGAHIAMTLALAAPDQIGRLVLGGMGERIVATVGLAPEFADALAAWDKATQRLEGRNLPPYAIRLCQHAASKPYNDLDVLAACLRGQSCVFDLPRLAAVAAPTLVIVGEEDKLAGSPYRVAALFPTGVAATVPDLNHSAALASAAFRSRAILHLSAAAISRRLAGLA